MAEPTVKFHRLHRQRVKLGTFPAACLVSRDTRRRGAVRVDVDVEAIVERLARRALTNKGGTASVLDGAVRVVVLTFTDEPKEPA